VSLIVIPFCLSVCLDVCQSFRDLQPTMIDRDHNQIWSAGIYLSSDSCKPFWIPYLPYFRCQREKYAKFRQFPRRRQWNGSPNAYSCHWERDASCHMTCHTAVLLVLLDDALTS